MATRGDGGRWRRGIRGNDVHPIEVMMDLGQRQERFAQLAGRLITQAFTTGYRVRLGETYRPPETAAIYAQQGKGIASSLHCFKLAIDLHLFRDGVYLQRFDDYLSLGVWWERQSDDDVECCWGGRFARLDVFHFSIAHEGRK